jgi:hypothetical protein
MNDNNTIEQIIEYLKLRVNEYDVKATKEVNLGLNADFEYYILCREIKDQFKISLEYIKRLVAFGDDGKAIVAGVAANFYTNTKVIALQTDHYDFVGYNVSGKTEDQIRKDNQDD